MPAPAAAWMAAAGLGLTVTGARATVTLRNSSRTTEHAGGRRGGHLETGAGLTVVSEALTAIARSLTGEVRVIVLRGEAWSLPTETAPEETARPERHAPDGPPDEAVALEPLVARWQAAFGWLSDRADLISVAAVAGPASGAGLQLALSCDLRVLAEDATLALPEAAHGLVPGLGVTGTLVDLLGYPTALDLCLTGRRLTAAEALTAGIAQRVVPAADLDRAVDDLVAAVLATPRAAAVETKALLNGARRHGDRRAAERAALARCLADRSTG
ncbi:enoyl-CoA hydratase/isomerase family protein [Pseudofrankia inefficax]|uniref:Enoyl-CoA hydratase/isomerase n=1 Tax=Pseudofrankia inefficax (strain DSM 45817 / CECT 9037 / DDB 130130 / EuI1c) TaxID=298654 RepID=E3J0Q7_PSEI1|nr:enoyl-CoA hydratase/isomerase family protein [Pseudofrankia inefficax]ADP82826.1 Enoyl-CoA hydratase/isomerase [Pseudofrankia inefficax]